MSVFKTFLTWVKTEVSSIFDAIEPGVSYIEKHIPAELIKLAEVVLGSLVAGTPWPTIAAAVITQAEAAGIILAKGALSAEEEATVAINTAQNNMLVNGTATGTAASAVTAPPAPGPAV